MDLSEATLTLSKTPAVVAALLTDLPPAWVHRDDGPGTWSAYDIVGHLLHGDATNWVPRAHLIRTHGTERAFEPFDREAMLRHAPEPVADLVDQLHTARRTSLTELASWHLTPADLDRRGTHPELGDVTLGQLLAAWVAHDLTHLAQIAEVLAGRYRHDVGPWRAYMPALDRSAAAE
ncbi:hypothetical protein F4553_000410 [Allocatelliglobosispora scoriae]|uniref:DinB-like domain-containing protein n=1 Tax=Allocatelliglobosispora scoriae TaxID=643052 RepID=A0A841BJF5_9ACTN|nr:DinB family protein [Allocatelliglobosispora scoriae]MBB5867031.1 hypothetical protein [Allocatelliglobosispora scoriae]